MNFEVYSWKVWFKSLSLAELHKLATQWARNQHLYKGHELQVMKWNLAEIAKVIDRRERCEERDADLRAGYHCRYQPGIHGPRALGSKRELAHR